jgi:cytochrome c553
MPARLMALVPLLLLPSIAFAEPARDHFENAVRPLLLARCIGCHGPEKHKGGLRLDSRAGWATGGDSGTAIVPGKPDESLLIKAVRYRDKDLQMPPRKALTPHEVEVLVRWVRDGVFDPRKEASAALKTSASWEKEYRKRLDWWSLKPLRPVELPKAIAGAWDSDPIDRFIKAGLEAVKLKPAPRAEPEVLLRRLSFVLTGLPPAVALRERFLTETRRDEQRVYERLVDELLASPHFGERFARHWMDVVRYTDTYGYEWDNPAKGSHEYRDYLIRTFNGDVPYDQFVREHLAGDLLSRPRINAELGINESLIAPMFYHMGEHRHGSSLVFNGVHQEMLNNKIDVFSKAFLATTVACSRCHDHKMEAVSQRDYYALAAVFMTPRWTSRVIDAPGKNAVAIRELTRLRTEIRQELARTWRQTAERPRTWPASKWQAILETKNGKQPVIEDITYPLYRLRLVKGDAAKHWHELAAEWRKVRGERQKHNQAFTVLADFTRPTFPAGWVTEGDGIQSGYVQDATPLVALEGGTVLAHLLPRGYHSHALSSKLPGSLRMPPDHLVPRQHVSLRLAGGQFGGYLEVHENAFQGEEVTFLNNVAPQWRTFADRTRVHGITQITREFATSSLNPNFPPRTGLAAGLPNNDLGHDKRSWISITGIVAHDGGSPPLDTLDAFAALYDGPVPKTAAEAHERISAWFAHAVLRWCDERSRPGDQVLLDWMLANKLLPNSAPAGSALDGLLAEYRRVENGIAFPRTVNSMDERERARVTVALNVRGDVDTIGEWIPPDFLRMFADRHVVARSVGSGRLELAESLLQADHPLTARVFVNRVWQWLMGTGLVATPNDFGRLGEKPTHPELLDYLANEFIREGWSTKKLIRRLVLTETFQQSGQVSEDARTRDPGDRLRHHYPTRRLEAEAIRDSLLAVSGRLDPKLYGRPILPPRAAEDGAKRLFAGPLDGYGRRSIYLQMSIMEPPKFLVGFNLPDLRLPTGRRDTTNVPAQALILLNDPFVSAMARHWGQRLVKEPHASPQERVRAMFLAAFARSPSGPELKRWTSAAREFSSPGQPDLMKDEAAWAQLGHAIFNAKEFLYYR